MLLRARQGFIDSIFRLAHVPLSCPHYTRISRRAKQLEISFETKSRRAIQHLAIDATGLMAKANGKSNNTGRIANVESGESYILQLLGGRLKLQCVGG